MGLDFAPTPPVSGSLFEAARASLRQLLGLGASDAPLTDSPMWWLNRLSLLVMARDSRLQLYRDYYEGRHTLAYADQAFRKNFGSLFGEYAENICELVVDAAAERLRVIGFRIPVDNGPEPAEGTAADTAEDEAEANEEADEDAWRIWQANKLDAQQQLVHKASLIEGYGYVGVWADPKDAKTPIIRVLDARSTIVAYDPEDKLKRRAAMRRWNDPWTGRVFANLYLPDATYKFFATGSVPLTPPVLPEDAERISFGQITGWQPRIVKNEAWPLPNPFGVVPIVPFLNKPTIGMEGISEIATIIPINNAINKLVSDMLLAAATSAYRTRYGINIPMIEDKDTGALKLPFEMNVDKFLAIEPGEPGDPEIKFGEFGETSLDPFVKAIEQRLQMAATISRTPHHYILGGQGSFPSGEALRAVEAPLIAKVTDKMVFHGESWEEVMRLAFLMIDDPRGKVQDSEALWADPENRTESQHADALTKQAALGVPEEVLWEKLDYTPQQIKRMKAMKAAAAAAAAAAPQPSGPPVAATAPGQLGATPPGQPAAANPATEGFAAVATGAPTGVPGVETANVKVRA